MLVDVSLSTDSWVEDRRVLDVEKEALLALAGGLEACGDEHAIFTFTSRRRDAVWVRTVKGFEERAGRAGRPPHPGAEARALHADGRRHAPCDARSWRTRPQRHRLLLLLTDGKPNDVDHYEGRYAIEDTRMAVREARRAGSACSASRSTGEARGLLPLPLRAAAPTPSSPTSVGCPSRCRQSTGR